MALITEKQLIDRIVEIIESTKPDQEYGVWKKAEAYDKILDSIDRYYLAKILDKKPIDLDKGEGNEDKSISNQ